jgi:CubicO group peptidase (beta-lactamase class C family)
MQRLSDRARRRVVRVVVLALAVLAGGVAVQAYRVALVGAGFAAKNVCSAVFISGRTFEAAADDLRAYRSTALDLVRVTLDRDRGTAAGSLLGLGRREAVYREGLGCTLAIGTSAEALRQSTAPTHTPIPRIAPWPDGDADTAPPVEPALRRVLDEAFAEIDGAPPRRTRAVVVVRAGRIVAERYAPGTTRATPLPGWSMAKSVGAALAGVLVAEGKLRLRDPGLLAAWRAPGDPRAAITLEQVLRMSSGLEFDEAYADPLSDVVYMLFGTGDAAAFAADKPLAHPPGTHWAYASGTTNVLMRAMREALADDRAYLALPRRALFDRIGMASALIEPDASGTFVGSSLMFATARDWARFGLLALNDGVSNGSRVLPEGWVRFMTTPAPAAPEGEYAAHWWRKLGANRGASGRAPLLPPDAFHAAGHGGQYVTVVPSRGAVIVRLGHAVDRGAWDQDAFAAHVLAALPH